MRAKTKSSEYRTRSFLHFFLCYSYYYFISRLASKEHYYYHYLAMRAIPSISIYYFVLFILVVASDIATSFQLGRRRSPTARYFANQKETPSWTTKRWNRKNKNDGDGVDVDVDSSSIFSKTIHPEIRDTITPTTRIRRTSRLRMSSSSSSSDLDGGDNNDSDNNNDDTDFGTLARFTFFGAISFFYWYVLVLGAAVNANGLPIPDFIPMVPGWPVSESDLAPVLEDSFHFFYISKLLHNPDAPFVSPPRLAVFNLVEAWIFAMLPVLWKDERRRLPRVRSSW
jgi:hypothetical protein